MDTLPPRAALRQCSNPECQKWLPATTDYFYVRTGSKDGLNRQCIECVKQHTNKHSQLPNVREQRKARDRRPENRTKQHERNQRPEHKVRHRGYNRSRYHRSDVRANILEYSHQPEVQARHRENERKRTSHPAAKAKKYAQQREYRHTPEGKENRRLNFERHRGRKRAVAGTYTNQQIRDLLKRQKYQCYYCSQRFEKKAGKYLYHVDHTFPLSRVVGTDIPANDISYLVLACPHCNTSKGDKFPHEWPEGGRLL